MSDSSQVYFYKIVNELWAKQAADLLFANPTGPVAGFHENDDSKNQVWLRTHINPDDITQVTFKNVATGTYAYVPIEREDVEITGNEQPYTWSLFGVGPAEFQIRTADYQYLWVLEDGKDETPIVLKPVEGRNWGKEARWNITTVGA